MVEEAKKPPIDSAKDLGATALACLAMVARHHGLNLTTPQLIADNLLPSANITLKELVRCARNAGLKAKLVKLDWRGLVHLRKALPTIVGLKTGGAMVLIGVASGEELPRVDLQDPNADEGVLLTIDRIRLEEAWTGEVLLLRRNYDIADEEQPFSLGLIAALVFRERRIVRDLAICALILGLFALAPIMFWRLLSDKVLYYGSMNTFIVLCLAMGFVILFEAIFAYLRSYLILIVTARVDIRLSEYMFDKLLRLPIDFFERTAVGKIGHDVNEIWKIRTFLTGQLFGTIFDSMTLLFFVARDVFLQSCADRRRFVRLRLDRAVAAPDVADVS